MHSDRWTSSAPRTFISANQGIRLVASEDTILYEQRCQQQSTSAESAATQPSDAVPPRRALPRFPSSLLEQMAGLLRSFWRQYRRSLTILLYLDTDQSSWQVMLPPQTVSPTEGLVDFRESSVEIATQYRLAGSFRLLPNIDRQAAELAVPPFDGVHLIMDPCRSWLSVLCFLHMADRILPIALDQFIQDEHDREFDPSMFQIRLIDEF